MGKDNYPPSQTMTFVFNFWKHYLVHSTLAVYYGLEHVFLREGVIFLKSKQSR